MTQARSSMPLSADQTTAFFEPEQGPLWAASEGQVVNLGTYVLCLLTFWLVLPLLIALHRYLVTAAHRYVLTDQRLLETRGLLNKHTDELELYRVKDISVEQPPLQRLFGRGRVVLQTSDRSTPTVVLSAVPSPMALADLVRDQVERCRVAKGVREIN